MVYWLIFILCQRAIFLFAQFHLRYEDEGIGVAISRVDDAKYIVPLRLK